MTLGGILKHLAWVEWYWFGHRLHGLPPGEPWAGVDWDADPDWAWHSADDDGPERLRALWEREVARSEALVEKALADGGLGTVGVRPFEDGVAPSLRWMLVHMIEEYARHNGHADLLREAFDGGAIGE